MQANNDIIKNQKKKKPVDAIHAKMYLLLFSTLERKKKKKKEKEGKKRKNRSERTAVCISVG